MILWVNSHLLEIFGALSGIIFVFLEIRQNLLLWPVGIITSAIYIWVFFNSKFYADMGLQFYYLGISMLGWYWWLKGGGQGKNMRLQISVLNRRLAAKLFMVLVLLQVLIWYILSHFTDSPIPAWDAFTTSVSIIATWMLARKILEHWILWIVADVVSMALYIYKGLFPTVVLFAVYSIMAVVGYQTWHREYYTGIKNS